MLAEKVKKDIEGVLKKHPTKRSAVMAALMRAQRERGFVSEEDMREIAELLGINPVAVNEVGGFYTMYNVERPVGKYHIQVCWNISCSLLGAEHLIEYMERLLGIKVGETTPDKRFTLSTVECLGSCGTAPMMQINDDYYENLTEEKIEEILKGLG
jgi:NADH-quinone oxidoreductase E subunit